MLKKFSKLHKILLVLLGFLVGLVAAPRAVHAISSSLALTLNQPLWATVAGAQVIMNGVQPMPVGIGGSIYTSAPTQLTCVSAGGPTTGVLAAGVYTLMTSAGTVYAKEELGAGTILGGGGAPISTVPQKMLVDGIANDRITCSSGGAGVTLFVTKDTSI